MTKTGGKACAFPVALVLMSLPSNAPSPGFKTTAAFGSTEKILSRLPRASSHGLCSLAHQRGLGIASNIMGGRPRGLSIRYSLSPHVSFEAELRPALRSRNTTEIAEGCGADNMDAARATVWHSKFGPRSFHCPPTGAIIAAMIASCPALSASPVSTFPLRADSRLSSVARKNGTALHCA